MGLQFQPNDNIQLLSTAIIQTKFLCFAACNQLPSCRILDYDFVSKQCRLFEGDSTTGSIISSSSSTSIVGIVHISSNFYSSIHGQSCQTCQQNRYEVCVTNISTCRCPTHTYWTGSICALQLFENSTCKQLDACRSDFNLTCTTDCYGDFQKCVPSTFDNTTSSSTMHFGITVAGGCNGSSSTSETVLGTLSEIALTNSNTLYVGDSSNRLLAFELNNRTGRVLRSFNTSPTCFFFDYRTSNIYVTVISDHLVYIWPANQTIPSNGVVYMNCSMYSLFYPSGIVVDSMGNVYIASNICHWITKWAPNATSGTLVAGSPTSSSGTNSQLLTQPYGLALDEANSFLYVADRLNDRIQRFVLGGSNVGVTVAGGNGAGSASNQFYRPSNIFISKLDGSLYITDTLNNRIQKWQRNATFGTTVAGSPSGQKGRTAYLMNWTLGLALDYQENHLYVADSRNNRVQRFSLY